jgi:hypothetical protein
LARSAATSAALRALAMTRQPRARNPRAQHAPMPDEQPVIRIDFVMVFAFALSQPLLCVTHKMRNHGSQR